MVKRAWKQRVHTKALMNKKKKKSWKTKRNWKDGIFRR